METFKIRTLEKMHFFLIFLIVSNITYSQNDLSVDDFAFICEDSIKSIEKSLLLGTRSFLIELEVTDNSYRLKNSNEQNDIEQILATIKSFLKTNEQAIVPLIFKGNFKKRTLSKYLNHYFDENIFFYTGENWPKIEELKGNKIQVLAIFETDIVSTTIERIRKEKKYSQRFSSDPLNKLVVFKSSVKTDTILLKNSIELWKNTGKPPNFIIAPKIQIKDIKKVASSLNSKRRFRGVLEYKGEMLSEISWANATGIISPAKFSFPLTESEQVLSPYKNGYRITPAEVIHHPAQNDAPRIFTAYDVVEKDKLIYDFSFDNEIVNSMDEKWNRIISKDILFLNDPERGNVLYLNTSDSFIDYSKENTLNFETPISISVWVKPERDLNYMGVLGFGMAFSVKLKEGKPNFTTATIKDHMIEDQLDLNKWCHLVIVYNPKSTVDIYLNGLKIKEITTSNIIPSNQSLVIGNNIWGEQFYGAIDDLKIWDRGLSTNEIESLFHNDSSKENNLIYIIIGGGVFLIAIFLVFYYRKTKIEKIVLTPRNISKKSNKQQIKQNTLHLFGSFHIDLISKKVLSPSFSPLNKQLLSFLILSTIDDKNGIHTNKLTEIFWPGVSKIKAKENRNGNIRKLRKVLLQIEGLEVVFEENKWRVITSKYLEVDIFQYLKLKEQINEKLIRNTKPTLKELETLLDLLKDGNILQNTQNEWVDYYKNKISNEVENLLSNIYNSQKEYLHPDLKIKIAKTILLFDNLNENALAILISELVSLGKHGLAKNAYASFSKNYKILYAEPFSTDYQSFAK